MAMPGMMIPHLLAVHISDGVLTAPWLSGGFIVAGGLALFGAWRIRDEEIPQVALLTAAFFVASQIHLNVGPTSAHLLLNGLVGVVLGRRAALAIPVGVFLQAALFNHGGFSTIGVNSCVMALPALLAWQLFAVLQRLPWVRQPWFRALLVGCSATVWILSLAYSADLLYTNSYLLHGGSAGEAVLPDLGPANLLVRQPPVLAGAVLLAGLAAAIEYWLQNAPEFPLGLLIGEVAVLATALLNCLVLMWGGKENWHLLAIAVFVVHLPIAVLEGIVLGFAVGYLARVKPEMLNWAPAEPAECLVDSLP